MQQDYPTNFLPVNRMVIVTYVDKTTIRGKLREYCQTYIYIEIEKSKNRFIPWNMIYHIEPD